VLIFNVLGVFVFNYIGNFAKINRLYFSQKLINKLKFDIIGFFYLKLINSKETVINSMDKNKIFDVISADLNVFEKQVRFIIDFIVLPFVLIIFSIQFYFYIGIYGGIAPYLSLVPIPVFYFISLIYA
jgi:hypothetical protein